MIEIRRNRLSQEYLEVKVRADTMLVDQPVTIAVTRAQPDLGDFAGAAWKGLAGTTRTARLHPDQVPHGTGTWRVYVQVTDDPEIPVILAGLLIIT